MGVRRHRQRVARVHRLPIRDLFRRASRGDRLPRAARRAPAAVRGDRGDGAQGAARVGAGAFVEGVGDRLAVREQGRVENTRVSVGG